MPPKKRKAAEASTSKAAAAEAEPAPKPKARATKKKAVQDPIELSESSEGEIEPTPKRAKKEVKVAVKPKKKATTSKSKAVEAPPEEETAIVKELSSPAAKIKGKPKIVDCSIGNCPFLMKLKKTPSKQDALNRPYSQKNLENMFKHYSDADVGHVTTEGMVRIFADAQLSMEGIAPFVLCFNLGAEELGVFHKHQFMMLANYQADNIEKVERAIGIMEKDLADNPSVFNRFYPFLFKLCLESGQKSLPMNLAAAVWSVVWAGRSEVATDFLDFVATKDYKGVTKDVWTELKAFDDTVSLDEDRKLVGYDVDDSSWPSQFDEYAAWVENDRKAPAAAPES